PLTHVKAVTGTLLSNAYVRPCSVGRRLIDNHSHLYLDRPQVRKHFSVLTVYVCICRAITDRQIREVVDRGAGTLCEVQAHLPVASCCGRCEESARDVIEAHVQAPARPTAA